MGTLVRDIMQKDLVTVSPGLTVRELTRTLSSRRISGAPVVAPTGEVLGVVSASDVLRLAAAEGDARGRADRLHATWLEALNAPGLDEESVSGYYVDLFAFGMGTRPPPGWTVGNELDQRRVGDIMTRVQHAVGPETPVAELASFLLENRIHRALVLEDERLVGIVSTTDILTVVASGG